MRQWWIGWRNARIADPRFRRAMLRLPLTRPVARARAARLFDLIAGFTYSQTLFALVETGVIERLADGPATADSLAGIAGVPAEAMVDLLAAGAELALVERVGEVWMLGEDGAALAGDPGLVAMVAHHRLLYADLADPVAVLRRPGGGGLADFWAYRGNDDAAGYSALMAASQPMVAAQVLDAYRFDRHRRVVDMGGGTGAFARALKARHPAIDVAVLDLAQVTSVAGESADTIGRISGDLIAGPLPRGHDCATLVRVLHDHDDGPAATMLRNIGDSLPAGGTLVLAEPMAGVRGVGAYFTWYLRAMGQGRPRTPARIGAMLDEAGFARWAPRPTALPLVTSIIVART